MYNNNNKNTVIIILKGVCAVVIATMFSDCLQTCLYDLLQISDGDHDEVIK